LVSVSVVLPLEHPWVCTGLIDSYRRLGQLHVAVLKEFDVAACALQPLEVSRVNNSNEVRGVKWACFGNLSPWEVVNAQGRKLVGLAQRRRGSGVLLVAGTLISIADWPLLCNSMGHPDDAETLRQCTVSANEITGSQIESEQFACAVMRRLTSALSASG
jgi:lipoate-protein ligase A